MSQQASLAPSLIEATPAVGRTVIVIFVSFSGAVQTIEVSLVGTAVTFPISINHTTEGGLTGRCRNHGGQMDNDCQPG